MSTAPANWRVPRIRLQREWRALEQKRHDFVRTAQVSAMQKWLQTDDGKRHLELEREMLARGMTLE